MPQFAVPVVVRDFELEGFGSAQAIQSAIEHVAAAQVVAHCRANKVFVVSAENERNAQIKVNQYCRDHHVRAARIDRPIEAEAL